MRCYLDRDGIINYDSGYVGDIQRFVIVEGIVEIIELLRGVGFSFTVVTNQSGIGRGYYNRRGFFDVSFLMLEKVFDWGDDVEIRFCPHVPEDRCTCRKPEPGLFVQSEIKDGDIMIGDKDTDMKAARRAGICIRILLDATGNESTTDATYVVSCHYELLKLLKEWYR